ncbi:OsmC family protein [candidate division WOR-3 bacterium]|nr:OsmC family protein [candidate division WOR-3 bacterium]
MKKYKVTVKKNADRAIVTSHGFTSQFGAKSGDQSIGLNATEVLLGAFGTCLLTNINAIARKMHITIFELSLDISCVRIEKSPSISEISFKLRINCNGTDKQIEKLVGLSMEYGTVTNTLLKGTRIINKGVEREE